MSQVLIGLFKSYRDGDEAFQALQALGLAPDSGHLYQEGKHDPAPSLRSEFLESGSHAEERAECAAHGEYLSICGAANRFSAERCHAGSTPGVPGLIGDASVRTLLIIEDTGVLRPATACEVLYDYGAVAVKDRSGHWRFSPRRNVCRDRT
jgi:hypothetical protein